MAVGSLPESTLRAPGLAATTMVTLAWGALALTALLSLGAMASAVSDMAGSAGVPGAFNSALRVEIPVFGLSFVALGVLVVSRLPTNAVGWIFVVLGLEGAVQSAMVEYAKRAAELHGPLPAGVLSLWLANNVGRVFFIGAFTFIVFLFPDGRFISSRWRAVGWFGGVLLVTATLLQLLTGESATAPPGAVDALTAGNGAALARLVASLPRGPLELVTHVVAPSAALVSLAVRYRRAGPEERQQIKWVLYSSAVVITGAVVAPYWLFEVIPRSVGPVGADIIIGASFLTILLIPISAAVAILKYRLYDIDVVISRTLVYSALAVFITLVYVSIVVGLGTLIGSGSQPNLGLSIVATAIVAVAFQPVRERLQALANRLVYGARATPYDVLSHFSERVSESYAADEVLPRMARVLADGTGSQRAEVWLLVGRLMRQEARWPADAAAAKPVLMSTDLLAGTLGADLAVEVRHQGELLGALTVTKRKGESLTPVEEKLVRDLASQAGLVLKNVSLTTELLARLDDLRASRQRLVAAQDDERRRLERNLHDGAQQNLVALKVKLGLAEMFTEKDPARARQTLVELQADADNALETLRDLARGIYPPLLADRGLVVALQSQARRATIPIHFEVSRVARHPQDVEAAVYFCCLEALQNVQKYADASQATVRLDEADGELHFQVEDDGRGFDPATKRRGSGLANMGDRLDALGGRIEIDSQVGAGVRIRGTIPIIVAVPA